MKKLLALCLILLPLSLQARVEPREGEEAITAEPQITIVDDQQLECTAQVASVSRSKWNLA